MSDYPEHDKLKKIQPLSQAIGEFLEWASGEGMYLCAEIEVRADSFEYLPITKQVPTLLAAHFGIDLNEIEAEKRQMLDHMRKLNEED